MKRGFGIERRSQKTQEPIGDRDMSVVLDLPVRRMKKTKGATAQTFLLKCYYVTYVFGRIWGKNKVFNLSF